MTRDLFPDGDFTFSEHTGEVIEDGKAYFPALLRLELTEWGAWSLVKQLVNMLSDSDRTISDERLIMQLTFAGSIARHDDDGNRIALDGGPLEGGAG